VQNSLLRRGQTVPEEITTQLTAVETRLAAREQSQVSTAAVNQGDTAFKDKVGNYLAYLDTGCVAILHIWLLQITRLSTIKCNRMLTSREIQYFHAVSLLTVRASCLKKHCSNN